MLGSARDLLYQNDWASLGEIDCIIGKVVTEGFSWRELEDLLNEFLGVLCVIRGRQPVLMPGCDKWHSTMFESIGFSIF